VTLTTLLAGDANCPTGGVSATVGATTTYLCNGEQGPTGQTGATGTSLSAVAESAGANCASGGYKILEGSTTKGYICNATLLSKTYTADVWGSVGTKTTTTEPNGIDVYYVEVLGTGNAGISRPLNMTVLNSICGDQDGCTVKYGMKNWGSVVGDVPPAYYDFRLFIDPTTRRWRIHGGDSFNLRDNDSSTAEYAAWDCYFTDAESTGAGNARADNAVGFNFMNASGGGHSDTIMSCFIVFSDH
jgi:hypothetical protein